MHRLSSETENRVPYIPQLAGLAFGGFGQAPSRETLEHFAAIVECSNDAIVSKDLNTVVQSWNPAATRIFGYTAEEMIGTSIKVLIPKDRIHEEDEILERIRRGERVEHFETLRRRKDGALIDVSLTISPIRDQDGVIVGASKIARDITTQKVTELQLKAELAQRKAAEETLELLMQEIQHRVKNSLATVTALASQTFKGATVDERRIFSARIAALGDAYALLNQKNWDHTAVRDVVERAIEPFQARGSGRIQTSGPDLTTNADKSLALAMILHELGTNASKYGALSRDGGTVSVTWNVKMLPDGNAIELVWQENGGPRVSPPLQKGFGSKLIENALRHTQGHTELTYEPGGLRCVVEIIL